MTQIVLDIERELSQQASEIGVGHEDTVVSPASAATRGEDAVSEKRADLID
jgi:hypothetical protein